MTEQQIKHVESLVGDEDLKTLLAGRTVREYAEEYAHVEDLYNSICSDLGIEEPADPNPRVTGWYWTDAVAFSACSKCGATPGNKCVTPKARKTWPPHDVRVRTYVKEFPDRKGLYILRDDRQQDLDEYNKKLTARQEPAPRRWESRLASNHD